MVTALTYRHLLYTRDNSDLGGVTDHVLRYHVVTCDYRLKAIIIVVLCPEYRVASQIFRIKLK